MALNHDIGEIVDGMDDVFRVVPVEKYQEQTRLTCLVKQVVGTKFKREIEVQKPIWVAALEYAQIAFRNSGAQPGGLAYDCIAQEYPRVSVVCFIFNAEVAGKDLFVTAPFGLTESQIADLTMRDLWQPYRTN